MHIILFICLHLLALINHFICLQLPQGKSEFLQLLHKIKTEQNFETLVVFKRESTNYLQELLQSEVPVILLSATATNDISTGHWNSQVLIEYCIDEDFAWPNLENLLKCLGYWRQANIIFYWQGIVQQLKYEQQLHALMQFCESNSLMNVISVFEDFGITKHFYSFTQFPNFKLQQKQLNEECFPKRVTDMQGAAIRTLPDQNAPRSIVYYDAAKKLHVAGYMTEFVIAFCRKHNATLVYPLQVVPQIIPTFEEIFNLTQNNSLDIAISTFTARPESLQMFSSIVEQAVWFVLLPLAMPLPIYDIFFLLFYSKFSLLLMLLLAIFSTALTISSYSFWHQRSLKKSFCTILLMLTTISPSLLGQPMHLSRRNALLRNFLYALLFFAGIYVNTTYCAHLQSYLTNSPKPADIHKFFELSQAKIRIRISKQEYIYVQHFVSQSFWQRYKNIFIITQSLSDYYRQRSSLDIRYAYSITNSLLPVLIRQQSRLPRPLFQMTPRLIFASSLQVRIPLHVHSIYRDALNNMISQFQESGLFAHLQYKSYYEMVKAGAIPPANASTVEQLTSPLTILDFYWIWCLYYGGIFIAIITFILEMLQVLKLRKDRK